MMGSHLNSTAVDLQTFSQHRSSSDSRSGGSTDQKTDFTRLQTVVCVKYLHSVCKKTYYVVFDIYLMKVVVTDRYSDKVNHVYSTGVFRLPPILVNVQTYL